MKASRIFTLLTEMFFLSLICFGAFGFLTILAFQSSLVLGSVLSVWGAVEWGRGMCKLITRHEYADLREWKRKQRRA